MQDHKIFMREALHEAQRAYQAGEVPIGCVIVDEGGTIIARSYNQVESRKCQTGHAEVCAVEEACRIKNDWRLEGCWVYVTLEPCAMCMNLLVLSRVAGVVYGASSPLFGYSLDNSACLQLYRRDALKIIAGVLEQEAALIMKQFFQEKRKESSDEKEPGSNKKGTSGTQG